nr:bacillithiol biosynthesis BshC [Acidobacteriota bacterium]
KILNRPVTPIRHRASLTVIEAKHQRTLEKYNLEFTDLFKGKENILAEIVEKFLSNKAARTFNEVEEAINAQLNRLDKSLIKTEPTLSANLANRRKKIIWHVNALRKKYHRAEILKNEIVYRRIENLFIALLPHNALQERTINLLTFLNLYGTNFIDWIYEAIETDEKGHKTLYL